MGTALGLYTALGGKPHLHIHAQLPGTLERPISGVPVPIRFQGRCLVRNDIVDMTVPPHPSSPEW